jgi:hypothetical protein
MGTGANLRPVPHAARIPAFWSPKTDIPAMWNLLIGSPINFLLILVPLGYLSHKCDWSPTWVFGLVRCCAIWAA